MTPSYVVVVPTIGRPSLAALLRSLSDAPGPAPRAVVVVDDRTHPRKALPTGPPELPVVVVPSGGRGPAAARNAGWRAAPATEWVVFLDDDVVVAESWRCDLANDLQLNDTVAAVEGRVQVPRPRHRPPTDWERTTLGLESARWITADMAVRRDTLRSLGGFDERFRRAYREDCDLALRILASGGRIAPGRRTVVHPVRPAGYWVSVRAQAGNADDVLMDRLHGAGWRDRAHAPRGALRRHVAVTLAAAASIGFGIARRPRPAIALALLWAGGTAAFAVERLRPGPRDQAEVVKMIVTSVAIPPAATGHRLRGMVRHRHATPWPANGSGAVASAREASGLATAPRGS